MKQLKFITKLRGLIVLVLALMVSGNAWADEEAAYTLTPTENSATASSTYAEAYDFTINGITWSATGNTSVTPWRIGGSGTSAVERTIYSKTAITDNITSVVVTNGTTSRITVNSFTLTVASDADFTNIISTVTGEFTASGTTTFTRPTGADWSGRYYKFTYNVTPTSTSRNGYAEFTSAVFNKETVTTYSVSLPSSVTGGSITASSTSGLSGDGTETITLTPTASTGYKLSTLTVTDASSNTVATEDNGDGTYSFTMPASNVTVSATFTVDMPHDRPYAFQVTGTSVYLDIDQALETAASTPDLGYAITLQDEAFPIRIAEGSTTGTWTFQSGNGDNYMGATITDNTTDPVTYGWTTVAQSTAYDWTVIPDGEAYTIARGDGKFVKCDSKTDGAGVYCDGAASAAASFTLIPYYFTRISGGISNGTVTYSYGADYKYQVALAGQTVTLTETPADGYEFDSYTITYVDGDGNTQTITPTISGTTATFTMPAGDVTVDATFKATIPSAISVTPTTISLQPKGTATITTTKLNGYTGSVSYTVSPDDGSVITFNDGVVTAVADGTATITVDPEDIDGWNCEAKKITVTVSTEESHTPTVYSKKFDSSDEIYLYNKGTGLYLNIGGHWGTEGLLKVNGIPNYITSGDAANESDLTTTLYSDPDRTNVWGFVSSNEIYDASKIGLYCDKQSSGYTATKVTFKYNSDDSSYSIVPNGMVGGVAITYTKDGTTYYLRPKIGSYSNLIWRTSVYYWSYDATNKYIYAKNGSNYCLYNNSGTLSLQATSGSTCEIENDSTITIGGSYLEGGELTLDTKANTTNAASGARFLDTTNFYLAQTGGAEDDPRRNIVTTLQYSDKIPNIARWFVVTRDDLIEAFKKASSAATAGNPMEASFYITNPDFARSQGVNGWTLSGDDDVSWSTGYTRFGNALYNTTSPTTSTANEVTVVEDTINNVLGTVYTSATTSTTTPVVGLADNGSGYTAVAADAAYGFPAGTTGLYYHAIYGGYYNCRMLGGGDDEDDDKRTITQTLTDLVAGWYKLSLNGFVYNPSGCSAVATLYAKASTAGTSTGTDYSTATLKDIDTNGDGTDDYLDMTQAGILLYNNGEESEYGQSVMVYVADGATLEIGVELTNGKEVSSTNPSSVGSTNTFAEFDGLTLYYMGNQKDPIILNEEEDMNLNFTLNGTSFGTDYINAQVKSDEVTRTLILKRKMVANQWNTLILPVNITAEAVKTAFGSDVLVSKLSANPNQLQNNKIIFTKVDLSDNTSTAITAGKCYLVYPSSISSADTEGEYSTTITGNNVNATYTINGSASSPVFTLGQVLLNTAVTRLPAQETIGRPSEEYDDRIITKNDDETVTKESLYLTGSYYAQESYIPQYSYVITTNPITENGNVIVKGGYWVRYTGTTNLDVKGFRAWIGSKISGYDQQIPTAAKSIMFVIQDSDGEEEQVTAIDGINVEAPAAENTDNRIYNISGQIVGEAGKTKNLPKGIYIANGKKYIIK